MIEKVESIFTFIIYIFVIITFPLSIWFCFVEIKEYERAVMFRYGHLIEKAKGPGLIFFLPFIEVYEKIDLRILTYKVPTQEILTKDAVTILVDAIIYFKVFDPILATLKIKNFVNGTNLLGATTLRNELGTKTLSEVLAEREEISISMQLLLDEATEIWGVKVDRVEIKDVALPLSMQRAMAAEGEATREAKAKIIAAEGEFNASKALKEASDVIASNPVALQLRYLQTLTSITSEQTKTCIFPLPIDLIQSWLGINKEKVGSTSGYI